MNRLHHLQYTLPKNIADNKNYKNLEFIILNYNSSDDLESYIKANYKELLDSGRLNYYKITSPQYFNRTHSRNLAFKLAKGNIICNIDADNYTGKNFADYVNKTFKNEDNIYMRTLRGKESKDVIGRTCVKREDFYQIRGYDENMVWYGFEDYDFTNRLELIGLKKKAITDKIYLHAILHEKKERLINEQLLPNLYEIFCNHISPACTDMLFLFKSGIFINGILINNKTYDFTEPLTALKKTQLRYKYSILQDKWLKGKWINNIDEIELHYDDAFEESFKFNCNNTSKYCKISDPLLKYTAIMRLSQITNRIIMHKNLLDHKILTNEIILGKEIVFQNFDYSNPIYS